MFKQLAVLDLYSSTAAAPVVLALASPLRNKSSCVYAIPLVAFERHTSASSTVSATYSVQSATSAARQGTHASLGSSLSITSSTFAAPSQAQANPAGSNGTQQHQPGSTISACAGCIPLSPAPNTSGSGTTPAINTASNSSNCSCPPNASSSTQDSATVHSNPVAISSIAPVDPQSKYASVY